MSNWLRGLLIVVCVLLIWWLAVQFGAGMSEDPSLQAPSPEAQDAAPPSP